MIKQKSKRYPWISFIYNKLFCDRCGGVSIYVKDYTELKYWEWMKRFKQRHKKCFVKT